jgi:hypothetical protein
MWEKDKILIKKYRDCMSQLIAEMKAGEDVDFEGACVVESEKLQSHVFTSVD